MRDAGDIGRPVGRIPITLSGQNVPDTPCYLLGVSAGTLYAQSERQIAEGAAIVISLDQVTLSGVVMGGWPYENQWMISIGLPAGKRRLEERIPFGREGKMGIVEKGKTELHPCVIINTSPHGLGLQLGFPVEIGTQVCVEMESSIIFGEVRHCRTRPDGTYIAGVLIVDVVTDLRNQSRFSMILDKLRWRVAAAILDREVPAYRGVGRKD